MKRKRVASVIIILVVLGWVVSTFALSGAALVAPATFSKERSPLPPFPTFYHDSASGDGSSPSRSQPPSSVAAQGPSGMIRGVVYDAEGPVSGATVRVRLTERKTLSAENGAFILTDVVGTEPVSVTAWAEGYYVGWSNGTPRDVADAVKSPITITLKPHYTTDNLDYTWFSFGGIDGSASCAPCHPAYDEWKIDAHSQSATNPRFLTMYEGTDVDGNQSPPTEYADGRAQPPDPDQTYYGPGYKLDYPDRAGNCAACHTPLASSLDPDNTCGWSGCHTEWTAWASDEVPDGILPTDLTGDAADGVGCDFCHKIGDVYINPQTGLPYPDRPGISSMRLYRPEEGHELFFGTFDDVTRRVSYLPLEEESAFCAPCHYGVFDGVVGDGEVAGGVVIYNSFGEWLESPYSDPETGQTCQDCHMPTVDYDYFVYPEKGGLRRDPDRIHDHYMPGASDVELLQNSVTMTATAQLKEGEVHVKVEIINDKTGHHVPTGAPQRHLILIVKATDADGQPLPLQHGPVLPDWAGGHASLPGETYAKVLEDEWTGESPTAAYWRPIRLVEDTRIAAFETATSRYRFALGDGPSQPVTIEVRLIFRRAFQALMDQKGWDDPDIIMEEETLVIDR